MGLALRQKTRKGKQFGIPLESPQGNFDWIPFLLSDFPFVAIFEPISSLPVIHTNCGKLRESFLAKTQNTVV